jgi:hypothetical protein
MGGHHHAHAVMRNHLLDEGAIEISRTPQLLQA